MVAPIHNPKRFPLGSLVLTPGAIKALVEAGQSPVELLAKHQTGDWGDLEPGDKRANEIALKDGERILSSYTLRTGVTVWVITESDRSSTCILLPHEH